MLNPYANKTPEEKAAIARKSAETRRRKKEERQAVIDSRDNLKQEIASLQRQIARMNAFIEASTIASMLTGKHLASPDEIVAKSQPYGECVGVYFLIRHAEVVYVGQSVNIHARMNQHRQAKKDFDSFAFIRCEREHLDVLESLYIHTFRPRLNLTMCNNAMHAPLPLDEIMNRLSA